MAPDDQRNAALSHSTRRNLSYRQLLTGLLADHVLGVPVGPIRVSFADRFS